MGNAWTASNTLPLTAHPNSSVVTRSGHLSGNIQNMNLINMSASNRENKVHFKPENLPEKMYTHRSAVLQLLIFLPWNRNILPGWSVTAGSRGISLPTQAYPPATFPKALMVLLKTYLTLPSRTLCSRGVLARTTCREGEMALCANYIRLMLLFPLC